ncbi:hypothetical protein Lalb_Chr02g0158161 [Lupinus albus]|uniref:Uncharacterized protein n=1 Tax=Lupinus albus TaxID=3870 RepID=A0A6A4R192_LUPAL|nr:hypothetical protein Lalb_Chr02g0158161 [Lupinus albus]
MERREEEEERREAAIASTPCLQPNFKPKGSLTNHHLSKFRELHNKRLQLKSKSKFKTKSKGGATVKKSHGNDLSSQSNRSVDLRVDNEEPIVRVCEGFDSIYEDSKDNISVFYAPKKQKLHWGLDTKERWERKSNM